MWKLSWKLLLLSSIVCLTNVVDNDLKDQIKFYDSNRNMRDQSLPHTIRMVPSWGVGLVCHLQVISAEVCMRLSGLTRQPQCH